MRLVVARGRVLATHRRMRLVVARGRVLVTRRRIRLVVARLWKRRTSQVSCVS
jgi:hypothetical protein